jgi:hypothetical protein
MDRIVEKFLSRPDGLNHLLLSDVNHLMTKINNEFPMLTRYYSIGQSTEFRDINVLEINTDFNKAVNLTETPDLMLETMNHLDLDSAAGKSEQDMASAIFDILN